ncbi:MAG: HEAT repeat domain-containing protein [Candidatus Aminicenantes bacterium]|nr:HEAT repeat domain-containing protein [Candidatus Aminicenantes bacterium]
MSSSDIGWADMTLEDFRSEFFPLPPQEQVKFIYTRIENLSREERIRFLLSVLQEKGSSPLVKATALKFLRESSFQEPEVYESFLGDDFRALANAAKRALKEFEEKDRKDDYYAEAVLRKLKSHSDKDKRFKILKAISRLEAPWVLRVLMEALADPSEANRDFLIRELGKREIWNFSPVYEKLSCPPWYRKSAVLKVIGRRRESAALPAIRAILADPNVDVRKSAADALGEIGGKESLSLLVELTKDPSAYVRQAAVFSLRKISSVRFSG